MNEFEWWRNSKWKSVAFKGCFAPFWLVPASATRLLLSTCSFSSRRFQVAGVRRARSYRCSSAGRSSSWQVPWRHLFPTARICSSSGRETRGVGLTGTVGSSVTVGKACEPGQIAWLVLHGFMLHSGLGAPAVQLLTAALLFCSVRGDSCLSEWGIHRPFSTPAPEKVCCGSSSSESSWRERQTEGTAGSQTFEAQALEPIRLQSPSGSGAPCVL